jgi:hypothetical protein
MTFTNPLVWWCLAWLLLFLGVRGMELIQQAHADATALDTAGANRCQGEAATFSTIRQSPCPSTDRAASVPRVGWR